MKFPTIQEITQAITDGIERADEKRETNHPTPPPDYSSGWFNFLLVVFTGGLVVVGAANCYLIFYTLKATEIAAKAATESAKVAKDSLIIASCPHISIPPPNLCEANEFVAAPHICFSPTNGGNIAVVDKVKATIGVIRHGGQVGLKKTSSFIPVRSEIEIGQTLGEYSVRLNRPGFAGGPNS